MLTTLERRVEQTRADALPGIVTLIDDVAAIKRMRVATFPGSLADRLFARCWCRLVAGHPPHVVAGAGTAEALVAARLGGADRATLVSLGLTPSDAERCCRRALAASGPDMIDRFAPYLDALRPEGDAPAFVEALCAQPRAGATKPCRHRLIVLPAESHGDHCLIVAVGGVLLAREFGADPAIVFLAGLAHHLHNARLPDIGFEGEALLGNELGPLMARLRDAELATLPESLGAAVRTSLQSTATADAPEGRAFHAADVIDRVLQVRYHAAAAAFRAEDALVDMELVHPGPLQAFQQGVLTRAGLL